MSHHRPFDEIKERYGPAIVVYLGCKLVWFNPIIYIWIYTQKICVVDFLILWWCHRFGHTHKREMNCDQSTFCWQNQVKQISFQISINNNSINIPIIIAWKGKVINKLKVLFSILPTKMTSVYLSLALWNLEIVYFVLMALFLSI